MQQIQRWLCHEMAFTAQAHYDRPFYDVDMTAVFTHEDGTVLERPAFWDGGDRFVVRFAPTKCGIWNWVTKCSDRSDTGLHGQTGTLECVPYTGDLAIYQHGFVKISDNHRHFVYDDGTPFFYLGDTHWLMPGERFDSSNVEGIPSHFCFNVDMRVAQGFTVYQSEPLSQPDLTGGFTEETAVQYRDFDKKFAYVAAKGLLHTNAQLVFAGAIQQNCFTAEYLVRLTRMWSARFAAYPVLWTVAQEVDPDFYGHACVDKWIIVGETLYLNDCYRHPLTGHMCNEGRCHPNNTVWGHKYYHSWFGMQPQGAGRKDFKEFYDFRPTKPIINYETAYEHLWNTEDGAVDAGYRSFFNGAYGYGYGAHGVWNNGLNTKAWMNYGGFMRWFEGMLLPGAARLWHLRTLLTSLPWWNIEPRFEDTDWWNAPKTMVLASIGTEAYFLYDHSNGKEEAVLKQMEAKPYYAYSFDTATGAWKSLPAVTPVNGQVVAPRRNGAEQLFVFSLKPIALDFVINTAENASVLFGKKPIRLLCDAVSFASSDESIATVSPDGVVTGAGKNGTVCITAVSATGKKAERFFVAVQQEAPVTEKPQKISIRPVIKGKKEVGSDMVYPDSEICLLPEFEPENFTDQNCDLEFTDAEGKKTYCFRKGRINNYTLFPVCNGEAYVRLVHKSGVCSERLRVTTTGYGDAGLLLGAYATCDDYHDLYDPRCLPSAATNGVTSRFSGWCSEKSCSFEDPAVLTVTPKEPGKLNRIMLYTTDQGYTLRSFDVIVVSGGKEETVAEVRDNEKFELEFRFETKMAEAVIVRCYVGDGAGQARIDQISGFYEE